MKALPHAMVALAALTLGPAKARAADADLDKLQGKWTVESFEYNGGPVEMMKDAVREFKLDKYTLTPKAGDVIMGTVKLDTSTKPKTIDLVIDSRTLRGIYELEGDTLKLSYNLNDGERPTEFVSKPDSGITLVLHKRVK